MRENILRQFGHVVRREGTKLVRVFIKMNFEGKRGKGRPQKRWLDTIEGCWFVRRGCGKSKQAEVQVKDGRPQIRDGRKTKEKKKSL